SFSGSPLGPSGRTASPTASPRPAVSTIGRRRRSTISSTDSPCSPSPSIPENRGAIGAFLRGSSFFPAASTPSPSADSRNSAWSLPSAASPSSSGGGGGFFSETRPIITLIIHPQHDNHFMKPAIHLLLCALLPLSAPFRANAEETER